MFMLCASTAYHTYNAMGQWFEDMLLRIDLVGIGVMIFTMTIVLVFVGYHSHEVVRDRVSLALISICLLNFGLQLTPCYSKDSFEIYRVGIYVVIIVFTIILAISWYFWIAPTNETNKFTLKIASSFVYLGIGFYFYGSKFPESKFQKSRFVQLWIPSHFWWHIFVFINSYTLFWLLFEYTLYIEKEKSIKK